VGGLPGRHQAALLYLSLFLTFLKSPLSPANGSNAEPGIVCVSSQVRQRAVAAERWSERRERGAAAEGQIGGGQSWARLRQNHPAKQSRMILTIREGLVGRCRKRGLVA
jgi:hypothetical protein